MKKYRVELLTEARQQLREIAVYHKVKIGSLSAKKVTDRILDGISKLSSYPEMGVIPPSKLAADAGYRMLIINDYLCFYMIAEQTVFVAHIVHGSTDYIKILFR